MIRKTYMEMKVRFALPRPEICAMIGSSGGRAPYVQYRGAWPPMPDEEDFCMSLIGTECSICLQYPTKFARDWFVERFQALIDDILSSDEKEERAKRN